jgi:hypothetical protein
MHPLLFCPTLLSPPAHPLKRSLLKEERMLHDTKRAAADQRRLAHREEHRANGQMCEHGVWRCRICFPHNHHRH